MSTIIKNGTIVTATDIFQADLKIEDGKISMIAEAIPDTASDSVIDASGKLIFPGAIDPHTHLDMPFGDAKTSDDFYSGSKAAIYGGTTTVVDFAIQRKGQTLKEAVKAWNLKAEGKSFCDYSFHVAVTDCTSQVLTELETFVDDTGVSSIKMFLAYKGLFQVDDGVLFEVFRKSTTANYLVSLHCENGDIIDTLTNDAIADGNTTPIYHALTRPSYLEAESITRAATIAHAAGASMYVVHLSSGDGLRAALEARNKGLNIYIETCPQYLLLDDTRYLEADFGGAKYVMSPPLRKPTDNEDIWSGVQKNQIEVLGTDHCAFNFKGMKERGIGDFRRIPNGAPGIETRFGLLYTYGVAQGKINLNQFVRLMSYNAAKIFGLYPQKGTLAVGSDADIVVYNPEGKYTIGVENLHEEVDYTSYEGFVQQGKIEDVFVRGQHLIHQSNLISNLPTGKFIRRNQFKPSN